ncbi:VCBS repeat-containing protein [Streptomyces sp. NPDC050560]|uniref:VCBS repeat-containing protein n=1 Tax=Streptomyces sp. NPDC050560 TaxID=3365630 RepID=UPI0037A0016E
MNTRRAAGGIGLAAAIAVTLGVTAPVAQADTGRQQSKAGGAPLRDDFNGDGYADVAFPAPDATVDGKAKAGYVAVVYGSAHGLDTSTKQVFDQNAPGMPGTAEAGDAYGSSVTTGDLDGDGYADLVVGSAGEDPTESYGVSKGSLAVVWGGPEGLGDEAATLPTKAEGGDEIGSDTVVGDFDGDGALDIATTVSGDHMRVLSGPFGRDGAPKRVKDTPGSIHTVLDMAVGDVNGDGVDDLVAVENDQDEYDARNVFVYDGSPAGLAPFTVVKDGEGEPLQGGESVGVGDVNGDGVDDIVAGRAVDGYDSDLDTPLAKGGMVTYIPGSDQGPNGTEAQAFNQDSAGVPGSAETQDRFGTGISVADIDGDGLADVSTGLPGEDLGSTKDAGAAITLFGKPDGLSGENAATVTQNTAGVPGVAEAKDAFGSATTLADVDGDGLADLVVGASGENDGAGSVWAFKSTADGVTPAGSLTFGAGTLGTVAKGAHLGAGFAY